MKAKLALISLITVQLGSFAALTAKAEGVIPYRVVPIPADSSSHGGVAVVGNPPIIAPPPGNNNLGNRIGTFTTGPRSSGYVNAKYCFLSRISSNTDASTVSVKPIASNADGTFLWQLDSSAAEGQSATSCYFNSSTSTQAFEMTIFRNQTNSVSDSAPWQPTVNSPRGAGGTLTYQRVRTDSVLNAVTGDFVNSPPVFLGQPTQICWLLNWQSGPVLTQRFDAPEIFGPVKAPPGYDYGALGSLSAGSDLESGFYYFYTNVMTDCRLDWQGNQK
jgi:hypothetical protein